MMQGPESGSRGPRCPARAARALRSQCSWMKGVPTRMPPSSPSLFFAAALQACRPCAYSTHLSADTPAAACRSPRLPAPLPRVSTVSCASLTRFVACAMFSVSETCMFALLVSVSCCTTTQLPSTVQIYCTMLWRPPLFALSRASQKLSQDRGLPIMQRGKISIIVQDST